MDLYTLVFTVASAVIAALLSWIGKVLVELKSSVAVITNQIVHAHNEIDTLRERVNLHEAELKEVKRDVTIFGAKL